MRQLAIVGLTAGSRLLHERASGPPSLMSQELDKTAYVASADRLTPVDELGNVRTSCDVLPLCSVRRRRAFPRYADR